MARINGTKKHEADLPPPSVSIHGMIIRNDFSRWVPVHGRRHESEDEWRNVVEDRKFGLRKDLGFTTPGIRRLRGPCPFRSNCPSTSMTLHNVVFMIFFTEALWYSSDVATNEEATWLP
ncbi:uncharacterized protein CLUP02_13893 [Colletotrichum lupini]|uniref:Uncharacterized protein n=1 Tax=Colletotrichum lupini TaxID=145971 RepID=A0A9Q8WMS3_9PEZI|nr:uncharacterized protein CLUP02_13893 [Colletotrichum lupini]UQC88370.1 hypothetical protein CLUP02_13893 [Colletotrichum lupini]